jgi:D-alanyl-D-alanine carboxypeptidase (penicillin-binding protein 5/6)
MIKGTFVRRVAALLLAAAFALAFTATGFAAYTMPIETANADESVYLFDLDTGKVILEQNADEPRYIASLTKMMTALLFLESDVNLEEEITIPESLSQEFKDIQLANGTGIGLKLGETVRRIDLLYGLLLPSANDAASVIASDLSGENIPQFIAQMNTRAQELGCTSTSFTCVHGLYDYGNVSTARDLAKIAAACYANSTYMQVACTTSYTLPATNMHTEERVIESTNLMQNPDSEYYRDYIRGMKTGFTTLAGRCFVTFAEKDGHTYGLVVLGSTKESIFTECGDMLDWVFENFSDRLLVDTQTPLQSVPLTKCRTSDSVTVYAAEDVYGYGNELDGITLTYDLPESVRASIKEGDVLGTATVYLDGYEVGTVDLVTHDSYQSDFFTDGRALLILLPCLCIALAVLSFITVLSGSGIRSTRRTARKR